MKLPSRRGYRFLFIAILAISAGVLTIGYTTSSVTDTATEIQEQAQLPPEERDSIVEPRDHVTVVATDSNVWLREQGNGPRANSELVAFNPDGTLLYYDDTYDRYWDVDEDPPGDNTVLYTASIHMSAQECGATTKCTKNVVERLNLTTGESERLYSQTTPHTHSTRWHDVSRVDEDHIAIADIYLDRAFIVNTNSNLTTWEWQAQQDFPLNEGGPFPRDWTHINDVEVLEDGRLMVSVRNQDQVVFLDREEGLLENWTLGEHKDRDIIYQQHNPDYIPPENGGPAVIVADSENNRVVEYQRENDEWERTWIWQDTQMQWPRDADRLPDGNTLISDSNGNRVFEVDRNGEIVWSVDIAFPYEAERLGTGSGSTGGPSAQSENLQSRSIDPGDQPNHGGEVIQQSDGMFEQAWNAIRNIVPARFVNAFMYILPAWMELREMAAVFVFILGAVGWTIAEVRWANLSVNLHWPLSINRKR